MTFRCSPLSAGPSSFRTTAITPWVLRNWVTVQKAVDSVKKLPFKYPPTLVQQLKFSSATSGKTTSPNKSRWKVARGVQGSTASSLRRSTTYSYVVERLQMQLD
ncbi:unnamed protein product, partial [Iphiclides podalirius]